MPDNKDTAFPTPSDVLGAVQRGLMELNVYLSQPFQNINVGSCLQHLDDMRWRLEALRPAAPSD
jgi:hypothetical protein